MSEASVRDELTSPHTEAGKGSKTASVSKASVRDQRAGPDIEGGEGSETDVSEASVRDQRVIPAAVELCSAAAVCGGGGAVVQGVHLVDTIEAGAEVGGGGRPTAPVVVVESAPRSSPVTAVVAINITASLEGSGGVVVENRRAPAASEDADVVGTIDVGANVAGAATGPSSAPKSQPAGGSAGHLCHTKGNAGSRNI